MAAAGLSPQVVTESIFAISREPEAELPTEVHLVTTDEGARRARLALLSDKPGWLRRLVEDWHLPSVAFDEQHIHVLKDDQGRPLPDIRSAADNRCAADAIVDLVRRFTADPDASLHVSLAGGRKTLGFFLGYALSLYGRSTDRLSHVLVSEPFESSWSFFYPTPYESVIEARGRLANCAEAVVTLADIPFVRLRDGLPTDLLSGAVSFSRAVEEAQRAVPTVSLAFAPADHSIVAGGERIQLAPMEFTLYRWFAERRAKGEPAVHWSEAGFGEALLERYARIVPPASGDFERCEASVRRGLTKDNMDPHKSKINKKILSALGRRRAAPYLVMSEDGIPGTRYRRFGLQLSPSAIEIETHE
jgi:CRISPR-associated protein (TIGR02584 family)